MRRLALLTLPMLLNAAGALATACPPAFGMYRSADWKSGQTQPRLDTPAKRMFGTRIGNGARSGDPFADRYRLAVWGCGSSCQQAALIDTRSGRVLSVPDSTLAYAVQPGSRLLIVSPLAPGERLEDRRPGSIAPPPSFYALTAGRLIRICP